MKPPCLGDESRNTRPDIEGIAFKALDSYVQRSAIATPAGGMDLNECQEIFKYIRELEGAVRGWRDAPSPYEEGIDEKEKKKRTYYMRKVTVTLKKLANQIPEK